MKILTSLLALCTLTATSAFAQVETYDIDTAHSGVSFKIRHFFGKVPGSFGKFSGTLIIDRENMENSSTEAAITVASVDTNNDDRDDHLEQDDYFNAAKFPTITFKSTKWEKTGDTTFKIHGDLTMMGKTKPVVLDANLLGFGEGRRGQYLTGWEATTTIDRTAWGFTAGQPAVGAEVEIELNIEGIRR